MRLKVNDVTYTSIKKNSPAYYLLIGIELIGYFLLSLIIAFNLWAMTCLLIIVFG